MMGCPRLGAALLVLVLQSCGTHSVEPTPRPTKRPKAQKTPRPTKPKKTPRPTKPPGPTIAAAGAAYGAMWTLVPTTTSDLFGLARVGANYSLVVPAVVAGSLVFATWLAPTVGAPASVS